MTDRTWVKIRSWHAIRNYNRVGMAVTECGRITTAEAININPTLPSERSCESCLRIVARMEDA